MSSINDVVSYLKGLETTVSLDDLDGLNIFLEDLGNKIDEVSIEKFPHPKKNSEFQTKPSLASTGEGFAFVLLFMLFLLLH